MIYVKKKGKSPNRPTIPKAVQNNRSTIPKFYNKIRLTIPQNLIPIIYLNVPDFLPSIIPNQSFNERIPLKAARGQCECAKAVYEAKAANENSAGILAGCCNIAEAAACDGGKGGAEAEFGVLEPFASVSFGADEDEC